MNPTPYSTPPVDPFGQHAQVEATGNRGPRVALGVAIAMIGIITGVVLWFVADQRYDDGVESLARAPVGCDTTLDFSSAGEYLVFAETAGTLPEVRGDCGAGGAFDLGSVEPPTVEVMIVDPDGNEVPLLTFSDRESYDRAGSVGSSIARIEIGTAGDHVVRVESSTTDTFAVAIGDDPAGGVGALRLVAALAAVIGLGVGLIVAFTRRTTRVTPSAVQPPPPTDWSAWQAPSVAGPPTAVPPQGPPAAPGSPGWAPGQPQPAPPAASPPAPAPLAPQPSQPAPPQTSPPVSQPGPPQPAPPPAPQQAVEPPADDDRLTPPS